MTLIERLESAEQGSRELDALVHVAIFGGTIANENYVETDDDGNIIREFERPTGIAPERGADGKWIKHWPKAVTSDLSSAVALVERVLPGWCWKVGTCHVSDDAWLCPDWNDPKHSDRLKAELGGPVYGQWTDVGIDIDRRPSGNVALALCTALVIAIYARTALLKALKPKEPSA